MSILETPGALLTRAEVPRLALTVTRGSGGARRVAGLLQGAVADELRIVRLGRKKLVAVRELERWLDRAAARLLEEESA